MLRLLILGDIHGEQSAIERVLAQLQPSSFQAVLLVGDLGEDPLDRLLPSAMERIAQVARFGPPVFFVPGNHDLPTLMDQENATNVDHRVIDLQGLRLRGIGGAGPMHFGFPYEWGEDDLRGRAALPCDLLLSHTPPRNCSLDLCYHGAHAGSEAIRERLRSERPRLLLCGHIHEAAGAELVDGVPCFNVGSLGPPFGAPQYGTAEISESGITLEHMRLKGSARRTWNFV